MREGGGSKCGGRLKAQGRRRRRRRGRICEAARRTEPRRRRASERGGIRNTCYAYSLAQGKVETGNRRRGTPMERENGRSTLKHRITERRTNNEEVNCALCAASPPGPGRAGPCFLFFCCASMMNCRRPGIGQEFWLICRQ